jgi:tetratricopeptide (TPR) repeat protein
MVIEMITQASTKRALVLLCALFVLTSMPASAQPRRRAAAPPAAAPQPPAAQVPAASQQQEFEQLAAQANAAREGDRLDEALTAYTKALALRSEWAEGWWYLATLLYDRDNYAQAGRAFAQAAKLQPKTGAPWAMLGLCEFQLAHYDDAYNHIQQGRALGVGDNVELTRVMRYHEGLLSILKGEFERGQQTLGTLSFEGLKSEDLIIALGLSVLRIALTPKQMDLNYRDRALIRRAGFAEHLAAQKNSADAQREYERLATDYAKVPGVQYAYGRFLFANRDDDGALAAFQREIENTPKHALARLQIAYIKLKNRDIEGALPFAEEGVKLYPLLPLGHYILGRVLLDSGQSARAITELEAAKREVPDEPKIYFALTRAYAKAGRKEDSERARETFTRLNKLVEDAAARGEVRGEAIPEENANGAKPPQP